MPPQEGPQRRRSRLRVAEPAATPREAAQPFQPETMGERLGGMARTALGGLTFGLYDEAEAGLQAALDPYLTYGQYREAQQGERGEYASRHPVESTAIDLAASVASPLNALMPLGTARLAQKSGKVASLARRAPGMLAGAVEGGIEGAARGEDLTGRVTGAAAGATLGGVFGAAAEGVGAAVRGVRGRLDPTRAGEFGRRKVAEAFAADDIDLSDLRQRVERGRVRPRSADAIHGDYDERILADLGGEHVRRVGEYSYHAAGEGAEDTRRLLQARDEAAQGRLQSRTYDELGKPPADRYTQAETMVQRRRALADPEYKAAFDVGEVDIEKLPGLQTASRDPAFRSALAEAQGSENLTRLRESVETGTDVAPLGPLFDDAGEFARNPTVRELDRFKRTLDDVVRGKVDAVGSIDRGKARDVLGILHPILDQLDEAVPEYGAARQIFRDESVLIDMYEQGTQAFKGTAGRDPNYIGSLVRQAEEAGGGALDALREGAAYELISNFPNFTGHRSGYGAKREAIKAMFGEEVAGAIDELVEHERTMLRQSGSWLKGSRTAPMQEAAAEFAADPQGVAAGLAGVIRRPITGAIQMAAEHGKTALGRLRLGRAAQGAQDVLTARNGGILRALDEMIAAGRAPSPISPAVVGGAIRAPQPFLTQAELERKRREGR